MTTAIIKSDSQIKTDVLNELKWDSRVDETDVGVQVREGIVTLVGNVDVYAKKIAAREAAHRVHGVLDVVDELQVKVAGVGGATDTEIARAVRDALEWDAFVPDEKITSTVSLGIVTLEGVVPTWSQRADAERVVRGLSGVRGVINQITVMAKAVDSSRIKADIEEALERQAEREARRIGVSVKDGVVMLTGRVRSWVEKDTIDRVVGFATGVKRVDDRLIVDPYT
ncbi:MAG: BON domain-containing protein [bacterium]|jgi:osmotically-inducible protein OsmY